MTEQEFRELVIKKFDQMDKRFDKLEKWQANLEKWQANLEKWQTNLEKWQTGLEKWQTSILSELRDFKQETSDNFEYTQKQIDQAFEKISENMEYEDKVDAVVDMLKANKPNYRIFASKTRSVV